mmetsp:Transcript_2453/g.7554  ORF Transcript_2453/g.7554 Transcript_2453/m.7554 type:complete len:294 (-) Transcript_2453:147-1028(-)
MRLATFGSYSSRFVLSSARWICAASAPAKPPPAKSACAASRHGASAVEMQAPAAEIVARARSKAAATGGSRSSSAKQRGVRRRSEGSAAGSGARASAGWPSAARMASKTAQQETERASGPTESSVYERGKAPSRGTRDCVGLKPVTPHSAAGMRTEPRVSEPSPITHSPSATATAAPELDPPGMRPVPRSCGLAGVPKCGFVPMPPKANSTIDVRPRMTAPAARRRATAGASLVAGGSDASAFEPASVTSPPTSNRSLTETGRPSTGERTTPAARSASEASASARARSAYTFM